MSASRKHIKIGEVDVYDTNLIYSRVLGLQKSRDIDLKDIMGSGRDEINVPQL